jgi:glutamate N-acetyltransferase/amino-acid N-acetyltransferase
VLHALMRDLALQVVKDGEAFRNCHPDQKRGRQAHSVSIANSPLVKTAIAGEDANWGRVVMAVGKSGEAADRDSWQLVRRYPRRQGGMRAPDYSERRRPPMWGPQISSARMSALGNGLACGGPAI